MLAWLVSDANNGTSIAIRELQSNLDKIGKTADRSVTTRLMVKECLGRIKEVVDRELIRMRIY